VIALANKSDVRGAIRAWKTRADSDLQNLAVFYFCGHAIANLAESALLARDFGDPSEATTLENAIDFEALSAVGMEGCKARRQCFLLDCCRHEPRALRDIRDMGDDKVLEQNVIVTYDEPRDWTVLYGTARDQSAHGLAGKISRFTAAFLSALEGAGSDDAAGAWVVDTYGLARGINGCLALGNRRRGVPPQLAQLSGQDRNYVMHVPVSTPRVPIDISCVPTHASTQASLSVRGNGSALTLQPEEERWQFELEVRPSPYLLELHFNGGRTQDGGSLTVRPAYREKTIRVNL